MNRSIVQDNYSLLRDIERESIKIVHNLVCVDGLFCGKAFILVPFGNHAKDIKPGSFLGWDVNILILELPAIWNISVCTDMAFVGIIYSTSSPLESSSSSSCNFSFLYA